MRTSGASGSGAADAQAARPADVKSGKDQSGDEAGQAAGQPRVRTRSPGVVAAATVIQVRP